ncbi:MAG: Na+-transporting NADH:ubiquinone oxidoreductase subunit G, partial [Bacteroidales bacterium]|nr:Na+-transporting NADH:ubiquinone oxidoreductase subunit G [Bacteroidales bacterium]
MKKLKSTLPNMAIVLTLISVIAGGLLAYVNKVTEGPIKEINEKTLAQGLAEVLNANTANVTKQDTLRDEKGALTAIVYTTDAGTA